MKLNIREIFSTAFILLGIYYIIFQILGVKIIFSDNKVVIVIVGVVLIIIGLLLKSKRREK